MKKGGILGYDLNDKYCQISYYDRAKDEPQTMETAAGSTQIPMVLGYFRDRWVYGREAKRLSIAGSGNTASNLLHKAAYQEKATIAGKTYDGVWLLAKFIRLTLERFGEIEFLTFSTPRTDIDMSRLLKGIGRHLDIDRERICVQDYKESFCQYMFYQPKELWQYESALFYCDDQKIQAYMLRKLNAARGRELFVTVDEVANAHIRELEALTPVLNMEKARDADESFTAFIQNVFDKKVVSSVYLTGEGFEKNWYPGSLKVLCNGRRAFVGDNLYSRGACYTSMRRCAKYDDGPVYLDETKMTEQITLRMRVNGKEGWHPVVSWGTHWYEADSQWEVILEDTSDIEIHVETLAGEELEVETVSLEGLPDRRDYSLRLRIEVLFLDERTCRMTFKDVGFGEFFAPSGFYTEKIIHLGGIHGQFNSMS